MINNFHLYRFCSISSDGAGHGLIDQTIIVRYHDELSNKDEVIIGWCFIDKRLKQHKNSMQLRFKSMRILCKSFQNCYNCCYAITSSGHQFHLFLFIIIFILIITLFWSHSMILFFSDMQHWLDYSQVRRVMTSIIFWFLMIIKENIWCLLFNIDRIKLEIWISLNNIHFYMKFLRIT
jgi:hypothetical protein